ncbi:hypothetical protein Tco_0189961 [Tanacetum coccineum]
MPAITQRTLFGAKPLPVAHPWRCCGGGVGGVDVAVVLAVVVIGEMAAGYDDGDGGSKVAVVMMTMVRRCPPETVFPGLPADLWLAAGMGWPAVVVEDWRGEERD